LRSENDIDAARASGQDRIGTASGGLHCKLSFVGSGGGEVRHLERLIALVEDGDDLGRTDGAFRLISKCNARRRRHCEWPAAKSKDSENLRASRRVIGNGDERSARPTAVGEKLSSNEQVARGGNGVPMQGSEPTNEKDEVDGPERAMFDTLRGASPVLTNAEKTGGMF
jgi:hypothetical protein